MPTTLGRRWQWPTIRVELLFNFRKGEKIEKTHYTTSPHKQIPAPPWGPSWAAPSTPIFLVPNSPPAPDPRPLWEHFHYVYLAVLFWQTYQKWKRLFQILYRISLRSELEALLYHLLATKLLIFFSLNFSFLICEVKKNNTHLPGLLW